MNDFLRMDIFFVVATIATVVLSVLLGIVLWYALRIARTLDRLSADIADEAHALKGDIDDARTLAKREGRQLMHLIDVARKAMVRLAEPRASRKR